MNIKLIAFFMPQLSPHCNIQTFHLPQHPKSQIRNPKYKKNHIFAHARKNPHS